MIELIIFILVWILNFGISIWNAYVVGRVWGKTTGWMKAVTWAAATMSVAGFTWCYLIVVVLAAETFNVIEPEYGQVALELGYLLIIFPIIGSGLIIWIQSLITAAREGGLANYGVAGWNTFANIWNIWQAFRTVPGILTHFRFFFDSKGGDAKDRAIMIVVGLVVIAIAMGIITAWAIIKWSSKTNRT